MSYRPATVRRMDGDAEQVVDGWWRGEPGGPDYEQVLIVRCGAALRVRWIGRVPAPDVKATNPSHAIQVATRLMLREWRRATPIAGQVPSPRGRAVR